MTRDIRNFDPEQFAHLDTAMWQAYYKHDFIKLFVLLIKLCYTYCKPNLLLTLLTAYHSAQAAIVFRRTKGEEDLETVLQHLTKFYQLLAKHNVHRFNYEKAAEAELEWWMVDRYPNRYNKTRAEALAKGMSAIYNVPVDEIEIYGKKREAAMLLIGRHHHDVSHIPDWHKIEALLNEAYVNLHSAVTK